MSMDLEDNSPKRCIDYANRLIELCELNFPRISSVQDINSSFFVSLFERITGHAVPDLFLSEDSTTHVHDIQAVIDTLSLDLLGLSLSHITGDDIVSGNVISIINLLEVLEAVFIHWPSEIKEADKKSYGNSKTSLTDEHIIETAPVKASLENEENIPSVRVLRRKTSKTTLKKHRHIPKKQTDHTVSVSPPTERENDIKHTLKPLLKRKNSKPVETIYKRPNIEGIEQLHKSNFEKKVKALLLQSDKSPVLQAHELRSKYIKSLNIPLKRTAIPPCKKSFLLPHNLRPKSKSPVRQHHTTKKTSSKTQKLKSQLYGNIKTSAQDRETPAALQSMLKEFPGFQFPENTLELLKKHYYQHVSSIHKQLRNLLSKKPKTIQQTEEALEEEAKLSNILIKDLQEKHYLRKVKEHKAIENRIKSSLRDARTQSVKMRQYFEEFHILMSRKLKKRNFSEEILIEKTFKEMLDLQKEKIRLLCNRLKEADDYDAVQHRKYLDALKNLYQDQLNLLAESVNAEQKESFEREKAKRLIADKMNREILKTLQKEVRSLQKDVLDMLNDIHFRELDAQTFIKNCQLQDL